MWFGNRVSSGVRFVSAPTFGNVAPTRMTTINSGDVVFNLREEY
jgi:hypothetical protein